MMMTMATTQAAAAVAPEVVATAAVAVALSVGTKGVKPTEAHMRTSTHPTDAPTWAPTPHKKVSWRDALFQRQPLVDVDSLPTPLSLHP